MTVHLGKIAVYSWDIAGKMRRRFTSQTRVVRWKWSRIFFQARNLLLMGRPLRVNIANVSFRLIPEGAVAADLWSGLRFERNELQFILEVLQPGMTFMDIGGNVGLFAIAGAKKTDHGRVYVFEPSAWTFQVLQGNIRLNGLSNVIAVRTALDSHIGEAVLQINAPGKDGLNTIGRPSHSDCQVVAQERVPIITLDAFVEANGISKVDVMKVDVEGAELLVFRGGKKLLQRRDAPLILYEGYTWCTAGFGYHPVEIMWLLEDYGYSFFVLDGENGKVVPRKPDHGYDAMVVAVKPEHPSYGRLQRNVQ